MGKRDLSDPNHSSQQDELLCREGDMLDVIRGHTRESLRTPYRCPSRLDAIGEAVHLS